MPIESTIVVKNFWKIATKIQLDFLVVYCDKGRDIDTPLQSTQPTRSKNSGEKTPTRPLVTLSAGKIIMTISSVIVKVFFSSIFYHVVLQSMIHMTHHSFIGYVLLLGRNVAGERTCCVPLLHDNAPVHKSNVAQALPNRIILHILQILHPAIIIRCPIRRVFFVGGILISMLKR